MVYILLSEMETEAVIKHGATSILQILREAHYQAPLTDILQSVPPNWQATPGFLELIFQMRIWMSQNDQDNIVAQFGMPVFEKPQYAVTDDPENGQSIRGIRGQVLVSRRERRVSCAPSDRATETITSSPATPRPSAGVVGAFRDIPWFTPEELSKAEEDRQGGAGVWTQLVVGRDSFSLPVPPREPFLNPQRKWHFLVIGGPSISQRGCHNRNCHLPVFRAWAERFPLLISDQNGYSGQGNSPCGASDSSRRSPSQPRNCHRRHPRH
jgi:hypothetical protein